jgi:hypothetical protein
MENVEKYLRDYELMYSIKMMLVKNVELQMLNVTKREGVSKLGKDYLFYVGKFVDTEGDVLDLKIGKTITDDEKKTIELMKLKNKEVIVDIALYPSGFVLKGTIVRIDI